LAATRSREVMKKKKKHETCPCYNIFGVS